jgi:hypothetical protein
MTTSYTGVSYANKETASPGVSYANRGKQLEHAVRELFSAYP